MQVTLESPSALTSIQANTLNNITDFDQNIALTLLKLGSEFPVDFDLAWQWLDFTTKANAKSALIECGFEEGEDFRVFMEKHENSTMNPKTSKRGRNEGRRAEKIWLTIDCFKSWGMMCRNNKGKQIRKHFLECERKLKQAPRIMATSMRSLLHLSDSELGRLAAHQISVERGVVPDEELMWGISPVYLQASSGAVIYAQRFSLVATTKQLKLEQEALMKAGWNKHDSKEIARYQKLIDSAIEVISNVETEAFWLQYKADFNDFECEQAALAENRSLVLQGA